MRRGLARIAAAGNAAALVLLVVVLANGRLLFGPPPVPAEPPVRQAASGRVLLVVIDALREDASRDPRRMPRLVRLAREGGRGVARVESWIPSTVAGIRAIAEGTVPEPASFLHDFGATRSESGGIFAGPRAFAAGPRLWADLYRPWLAGSEIVETVSGDDARVLAAGLAALEQGEYDLVVVHLSETDDAAHLERGFDEALRRADAFLGRLVERAGTDTAVVVTSDHGVTARGGHAGPEEDVVCTPVVVRGPGLPRGDLGTLRQRDLHRLILAPLGLALPDLPSPAPPSPWLPAVLVLLAFAGCAGVCRALTLETEGRHAATWLDAALWVGIALAVFGLPWAALLLALAALGWVGTRPTPTLLLAAMAGVAFGGLRLLDARLGPVSPDLGLPAVCALGMAAGLALRGRGLSAGLACALLPAVLARFLGETASLSTLDVRLAFRMADGPSGLSGAVTIVILLQALPALSLLAGIGRPGSGAFPAGLALALSGQAAATGLALAFAPGEPAVGSLATGLLVRLVGETTYLFLGSAALCAVTEIRRRSGRSRLPAATPP